MSSWLDRLRVWDTGVDVEEFLASIPDVKPSNLSLHQLPRGIDNVHIDVELSSAFIKANADLVHTLVKQAFAWLASNGASSLQISQGKAMVFVQACEKQMERAIAQARQQRRHDPVIVLQLAQIKHVLGSTEHSVRAEIEQLRHSRDQEGQAASPRALELQELLVSLSQHQSRLQAEVNRRVLSLMEQTEERKLRRYRKALLGRSWSVPSEVLFNPLLRVPVLGHAQLMAQHYTLIVDANGKNAVSLVNRLFVAVFADLLPPEIAEVLTWASDVNPASSRPIERFDQGSLMGFLETEMLLKESISQDEYTKPVVSWVDSDASSRAVLSTTANATYAHSLKDSADPKAYRRYQRLLAHQRRLIGRWRSTLEKANLWGAAVASMFLGPLLKVYGKVLSVAELQMYLAQPRERRDLKPKIQVRLDTQPTLMDFRHLEEAAQKVDALRNQSDPGPAIEYLLEFLRYRRDLKLAYQMHRAMDELRVLSGEQELVLSSSNQTLLSFEDRPEDDFVEQKLRYHVVVKADVRGSTELTQALMNRSLNPASHFSLNFFNPIEALLKDFGAQKVFIEGDAVILNLNQYEGGAGGWLALARACGLAREMLRVVQRQNKQTARHGLPVLELGVGLAISTDKPAFLQDSGRSIMISSAISVADRLSSSFAPLREKMADGPVRAALWYDEKTWRTHNVNGVLLERAGFERLGNEMSLHAGDVVLPGNDRPNRVYIGRYPDVSGTLRWLVLREPTPQPMQPGLKLPDGPLPWVEVLADNDALRIAQQQLSVAEFQASE